MSNDAQQRLVAGYGQTHNAKIIAQAYGTGTWEVYHLEKQMRETDSTDLQTSQRVGETKQERPQRTGKTV